MKRYKFKWLGFLLVLMLCVSPMAYSQPVGVFDGHGDVGTDVKPGSATYDSKTQQYEVAVPVTIFGSITMSFIFYGKK